MKTKPKKEAKAPKRAKAANTSHVPISVEAPPVPVFGSAKNGMTPAPAPAKKAKGPASQKSPGLAQGRKPSVAPAPMTVPKIIEKFVAPAATKAAGKNKAQILVKAAPTQPGPSQPKSTKQAEHAVHPGTSPVKEAVLCDMSRILSNPGLSDNHAKRLHSLFTSLAVNALLGE